MAEKFGKRQNTLFGNFLFYCILSANSLLKWVDGLPLAAVNVMTTIFPKLEIAMNAERIRSG